MAEKVKLKDWQEITEADIGYVTHTRAAKKATAIINRKYEESKAMQEAGSPVAWLYYGPPHEILRCFGVLDVYPENFGAVTAMKEKTSPFMEYAEELGLSTNTCSYLRIEMGFSRALARGESTEHAPYGGMARPTMFITSSRMCDPRIKVFDATRRYLNVPVFMYDYMGPPCEDPRITDSKACEHYIDHFVEGLKAMIRFLEEQTGKKLDWDEFTEVVHNSIEMWNLFLEINELRKHVPTPMPSEDLFVVNRPFMDLTGETEGVEFFREVKQELEERIAAGISVIPEEKYRILWLGLPTWLDMKIYNYLESKGAVSVMETIFHPYKPFEVDLSDPLRALATKWFWGWDHGGSDGSQVRCGAITGGNHILELIRDYKADGVIAHAVMSCRAVSIGHRHVTKFLREEAGVPVLYLESDMSDPRSYSKTEAREKVDAFIQILEGRK